MNVLLAIASYYLDLFKIRQERNRMARQLVAFNDHFGKHGFDAEAAKIALELQEEINKQMKKAFDCSKYLKK